MNNGDSLRDNQLDADIQRMFLRGRGVEVGDGPVIGILNSWTEMGPCNSGLNDLVEHVKAGVTAAGGLPIVVPTMSLAEPFTKPTTMYLRNLMAMEVEEQIRALPLDGVVLLNGCDKTVAAHLMGAVSANKPAISISAGPRPSVTIGERSCTIDDLWEVADQVRAGEAPGEWSQFQRRLVCGTGTCNVLGTAITMAAVAEILSLALPGSALPTAGTTGRAELARRTGARAVELVRDSITPAELVTAPALDDALVTVSALGGSTNAVLHIIAIAARLGIPLSLDRIAELVGSTPLLVDARPSGPATLEEFAEAGGIPAVVAALGDLIQADRASGSGRSWAAEAVAPTGACIRSAHTTDRPSGLTMLQGSLAPNGALVKAGSAADPRLRQHRGRAVVFDGLADLAARLELPETGVTADSVIVLRGVGPIACGMPEIGAPPVPRTLREQGVTDLVRITDGRLSGTATGTVIVHTAPEAAIGGPIRLIRDGDVVALDIDAGTLDLLVSPVVLAERGADLKAPPHPPRGWARLFAEHVTQADRGVDLDLLS